MNRRLFLALAAVPLHAASPFEVFSAEEAALVEAICDQVIPADDVPGAKAAGVIFYIDRQLAGPLKRFAAAYKNGIPQFRDACKAQAGHEFTELPFDAQTEFLRQVESGRGGKLASFFQMIVDHTMQGFYGSPEHGGNHDEASWKMLDIVDMMEGHQH